MEDLISNEVLKQKEVWFSLGGNSDSGGLARNGVAHWVSDCDYQNRGIA